MGIRSGECGVTRGGGGHGGRVLRSVPGDVGGCVRHWVRRAMLGESVDGSFTSDVVRSDPVRSVGRCIVPHAH